MTKKKRKTFRISKKQDKLLKKKVEESDYNFESELLREVVKLLNKGDLDKKLKLKEGTSVVDKEVNIVEDKKTDNDIKKEETNKQKEEVEDDVEDNDIAKDVEDKITKRQAKAKLKEKLNKSFV